MLAAVRCLEIIGEAASGIGPATVGMHNRLIRAYFDIEPFLQGL
jgi:uncharacterized protein with HEPN domain